MVEESSQSIGEPLLRYLLRNLSSRCSAYKHAHMVNYAGGAGAEIQGVM
jgi:hypothetical protein